MKNKRKKKKKKKEKKKYKWQRNWYIGNSGYEACGTPVTIYSTLELSERAVVLGLTPRNSRDNPGGTAKQNQSSPGCHF